MQKMKLEKAAVLKRRVSIRETMATEITPFTIEEEKAVIDIIEGQELTWEYLDSLPDDRRSFIFTVFQKALNYLALEDERIFVKKVDKVMHEHTRRDVWDSNHIRIILGLSKLTAEYGRVPNRIELSQETKLSRVTIDKHLKEYFNSEQFEHKKEEYILMREKLLGKVYKCAHAGDMRAAKIFLDATAIKEPSRVHNQQNNFIQINGVTITEEQLKLLPENQINKILRVINPEKIIKKV